MSKLQSEEQREVRALQQQAQIQLLSQPKMYDDHVKDVVSDLNQLRPWVVLSTTLDIRILLLHIQACSNRIHKSVLNKDSKCGRRNRRILKHSYIEALSAVIADKGSASSPSIEHVKLVSDQPEVQGNVI